VSKRTHKLRALGNVTDVIAKCASVTEAARRLGVSRRAIYDWISAGKVPKPGARLTPASRPGAPADVASDPTTQQSFAEWARATFDLSKAEDELVTLAQLALDIAKNPQITDSIRLQAIGQYRACRRDLRLPR